MNKKAFTLAEVLITLSVIGVVAAITLPGLIRNHNEKAWSTAQDVFTRRLEVATRQMNTEEKLAGYTNTMDFVNELKKYIKITRVCDSNELTKCFAKTIITANDIVYETDTDLKQLSKDNWSTGTVGVQFSNGVNALIAYNPKATEDPFNNQFSATSASLAIIYDVSGYKNPNTLGKDINVNSNVKPLGCLIKSDLVGGMCITKILAPGTGFNPMSKADCESQKDALGIGECYEDNDYWAGAAKACSGTSNMPSLDQLTELAKYIYDAEKVYPDSTIGLGLSMDEERAKLLLSISPTLEYDSFYVWSKQEFSGASGAYFQIFSKYGTSQNVDGRDSNSVLAVCISN